MPESIIYSVSHSGLTTVGDSITLAGEGNLSQAITVNKGGPSQSLTYLSPAVWQAYRLGAIFISPNPEALGEGGDVNSPLYGNRAATTALTGNYVVAKEDCGKIKELNANNLVITLPNASDFISDSEGKFYVTFLARGTGCAFLAGADATIENPNLVITQHCAVTAFLHVKGAGASLDAVWGLYGGVVAV